jgi:hypothetical protein
MEANTEQRIKETNGTRSQFLLNMIYFILLYLWSDLLDVSQIRLTYHF